VSALAKVRQMIRDEEQKAQDLEREITLMQREGHLGLQHGPPLQQRAQLEDPRFPQRDHAFPHAAPFQGVNYLDERSPLAPHLQVMPWPTNFRAGTYPKYNGSTDPAQYIMSYQVAVASSGGDDATMAKSFIIALEGPALTWFTRLPPLSIDSWRSIRDKFLLNFQGYRSDTDALAELSLCKQLEKETLREYYRKFLTLKNHSCPQSMTRSPSTTPLVAFAPVSSIATASEIRPRTSRNYISYLKNTPNPKSSTSARLSLKEAQRGSTVQPHVDEDSAARLRSRRPQSTASAQHRQPAPRC
jgi:hypothetical protein